MKPDVLKEGKKLGAILRRVQIQDFCYQDLPTCAKTQNTSILQEIIYFLTYKNGSNQNCLTSKKNQM